MTQNTNANIYQNISESILWQMPNYVGWKDINSVYLGCNKNFTELAGYSGIDSMVGIMDEDLKCGAAECAKIFREQDKEAMKYNSRTILDIHRFSDGKIRTCISKKTPLRDKQGTIIGTITQTSEINKAILKKIGGLLIESNSKYNMRETNSITLLTDKDDKYKLTKRESECLFYTLRGKTAKEIARILKLSPRTIEDYLDKVKMKFFCASKSELISKAFEDNYLTTLPMSLLPNSLSEVIAS